MPKVPRGEWGEHFKDDIQADHDEETSYDISREIMDLEMELNPRRGYRGVYYEPNRSHPTVYEDRIVYLLEETGKIKDLTKRKEMRERIRAIEYLVSVQHLRFLEGCVETFGRQNSPLESKYKGERIISKDEIDEYFREAELFAGSNREFPKGKREDFLEDLSVAREDLSSYEREPSFYTFKKLRLEFWEFVEPLRFGPDEVKAKSFGGTQEESDESKAEMLKFKISQMREVVSRMTNEEIRKNSEGILGYYEREANHFIDKLTTPAELFKLEAEIKDLIQKVKDGSSVTDSEIGSIKEKILELNTKYLSIKMNQKKVEVRQLFRLLERSILGEKIFDDPLLKTEIGETDWAWTVFGLSPDSKKEEIKSAYRKLAEKLHPDKGGDQEKLKIVNQAYDILRVKLGFK